MRDIQLCEFGNASMVAAYMAVRREKRNRHVLQAFIAISLLLMAALSGCSSYALPFVKEPGNAACVYVHWIEESMIQAYCPPGAGACATVNHRPNMIWTTKPAAFDDERNVLKLGHEFLHSLGATHR